jgi:hypothetical protein
MTAMMIGAVDQDAGDTGRSHLANRYFFGALHRGWPLDELDETEAARRAMGVRGPAELRAGGKTVRLGRYYRRMSESWIAFA